MNHKKRCSVGSRLYAPGASLSRSYESLSNEKELKDGRVMKVRSFRTVDPVEVMKPYRASDFALENLIDAGVASSLSPRILSESDMVVADRLEDNLEKFTETSKSLSNG